MNEIELINRIVALLEDSTKYKYVWLRFTYSNIANNGGVWVVWLEGLYGTLMQYSYKDLLQPLENMYQFLLRT